MKTAELPLGVDEGVDEEPFQRIGRLELFFIVGRESLEFGSILAADDLGFSIDAGFQLRLRRCRIE